MLALVGRELLYYYYYYYYIIIILFHSVVAMYVSLLFQLLRSVG